MNKIKTLITSGCLAKQNSEIMNEGQVDNVYHEYLNEMLVNEDDAQLDVSVMRYDRYNTSYERFVRYCEKHDPELVIFQLRYFHFLRLVCLLSYYVDDNHKVQRDLNLPLFRPFSNEINDPFLIYAIPSSNPAETKFGIQEKSSFVHDMLNKIEDIIRGVAKNMNTYMGLMAGNYYFAIREYKKMLEEIIKFSEQKKLTLIFLSPMPKPSPYAHYLVSKMLNNNMKNFIAYKGYDYIDLFSKYSDKGEYLFLDDKLHLNDFAHQFIASKLYPAVKDYIKDLNP